MGAVAIFVGLVIAGGQILGAVLVYIGVRLLFDDHLETPEKNPEKQSHE